MNRHLRAIYRCYLRTYLGQGYSRREASALARADFTAPLAF
jgi:hypothetical protein